MKTLTPVSFEQWVEDRSVKEAGMKVLFTYKLWEEKKETLLSLSEKKLSNIITAHLIDMGFEFTNVDVWIEDQAAFRAKEFGVVADVVNGQSPLQYLNFTFSHWEKEYHARIALQNYSLWRLLKWWSKRTWLKLYHKYQPQEILPDD